MKDDERTRQIRAFMHGLCHVCPPLSSAEKTYVLPARRGSAVQLLDQGDYSPQIWPDYETLLADEIADQIMILQRIYERRWNKLTKDPRLAHLKQRHQELLLSNHGQHRRLKTQRDVWLRRIAVKELCIDLLHLGLLEYIAFDAAYFGVPPK